MSLSQCSKIVPDPRSARLLNGPDHSSSKCFAEQGGHSRSLKSRAEGSGATVMCTLAIQSYRSKPHSHLTTLRCADLAIVRPARHKAEIFPKEKTEPAVCTRKLQQ